MELKSSYKKYNNKGQFQLVSRHSNLDFSYIISVFASYCQMSDGHSLENKMKLLNCLPCP